VSECPLRRAPGLRETGERLCSLQIWPFKSGLANRRKQQRIYFPSISARRKLTFPRRIRLRMQQWRNKCPTLLNCALQRVALLRRVGDLLEWGVLHRTLELTALGGDEGMPVKLGFEVVHSQGVGEI